MKVLEWSKHSDALTKTMIEELSALYSILSLDSINMSIHRHLSLLLQSNCRLNCTTKWCSQMKCIQEGRSIAKNTNNQQWWNTKTRIRNRAKLVLQRRNALYYDDFARKNPSTSDRKMYMPCKSKLQQKHFSDLLREYIVDCNTRSICSCTIVKYFGGWDSYTPTKTSSAHSDLWENPFLLSIFTGCRRMMHCDSDINEHTVRRGEGYQIFDHLVRRKQWWWARLE